VTATGDGPVRDFLRLWGPAIAWMVFVFAVSSEQVPARAAHVPDWMTHGAGYAVLAVLTCRALAGGLARPVTAGVAALAVLIGVLYGISDEWHQSFVPGRYADAWDLLKDLAGALVGAAACAFPRPAEHQGRNAA
jgi:VanZ family protein